MTDWSGRDYAKVSGLQRAMARDAVSALTFAGDEHVLDIGCGDGFVTHAIAGLLTGGSGPACVVGVDPSPRMIAAAQGIPRRGPSGPWFVRADARGLPFAARFDVVVSFNALHWVPEQGRALGQIALVARRGARVLIQQVCASPRTSLESVAMSLTEKPAWAASFAGFTAPFVHVHPDTYGELAASAGLTVVSVTVTDREWDFGSREAFARWCAVGSGAWTDRLEPADRIRFIDEQIRAYELLAGRPGLFRFTQLRAQLRN